MPNSSAHDLMGTTVGLAGIYHPLARLCPAEQRAFLVLGLTSGGLCGGRFPDLIEPAAHPLHRDKFHSIAFWLLAGLALVAVAGRIASSMLDDKRVPGEFFGRFDKWLSSLLPHIRWFLIGICLGFAFGHLSHIAADGLTPDSIPMISRSLL